MTTIDDKRSRLDALLTNIAASLGPLLGTRLASEYVLSLSESVRHHLGCFDCERDKPVAALRFDHRDRSTKYRTRTGRAVHPADMVKADGQGFTRYSIRTILAEWAKCDVRCTVCDARALFPASANGPRPFDPALLKPEGRRAMVNAYLAAGGGEQRLT
jgi:hypothetical protein